MVNKDNGLTLIDFDFCRDIKAVITDNLGTPGFQAPEMQIKNPSYYGAPVDIFALGVILYALDMQCLPFEIYRDASDKAYQPRVTTSKYAEVQESYNKKRATKILNGVPVLQEDAVKLMFLCLHPNPKSRMTLDIMKQLPYIQSAPRLLYGQAKTDLEDLLQCPKHLNE